MIKLILDRNLNGGLKILPTERHGSGIYDRTEGLMNMEQLMEWKLAGETD
jgi:hypothetical protein